MSGGGPRTGGRFGTGLKCGRSGGAGHAKGMGLLVRSGRSFGGPGIMKLGSVLFSLGEKKKPN